jgi:NAD(P)H-dependent flavin oxidoreductase YrpB (nitropropane dioxygenase family)
VSDNPEFLTKVLEAGGLPFLAMGNMPGPIAKESLDRAREKTGGRFGVGLIGLEVNKKAYENHIELMKENPPPFAILAAGGIDLAARIEEIGMVCYLHCPAPTVVTEGLKNGLRRFVFEGCESGGHIGGAESLDLWSANLRALEVAIEGGVDPGEVTILFAGGIATGRASSFVAGATADLVEQGLSVGLQMGTAYLATEEAVSTGAVTPTYRELALEADGTVIVGQTVNTRCRVAGSPMAAKMIERELERIRDGVPLKERKHLYEMDNLGCLRLASKGCAIDPETAQWDRPEFCDIPPEQQREQGLYLMGQVVSLLENPRTMAELHEAFTFCTSTSVSLLYSFASSKAWSSEMLGSGLGMSCSMFS